jgi:hypothetical protein
LPTSGWLALHAAIGSVAGRTTKSLDVMRKAVASFGVFLLFGCGPATPSAEERANSWQQRVNSELPIASPRSAVLAWAQKNAVRLSDEGPSRQRGALETLTGDGIVCSKWHISLALSYDASDTLQSAKVEKAGLCS